MEKLRSRWAIPHWGPNPEYRVIASMTQIFENLCHLTIIPVEFIEVDGAENWRGELYLSDDEGFEGRVKEFYECVHKEEYLKKGPYHKVIGAVKRQMVMGPQVPEIRWGCLRLVGGENYKSWDSVRKMGYWRVRREVEDTHQIIHLLRSLPLQT